MFSLFTFKEILQCRCIFKDFLGVHIFAIQNSERIFLKPSLTILIKAFLERR